MFTGIIQGLAEVKSISKIRSNSKSADTKLCINLGGKLKGDLKVGDSLSINGTCLTATRISKTVDFEIINETMNRTCLGLLKAGDKVNIERSLRLSARLDGHFLLGHVDGIGIIKKIIKSPIQTKVWIRIQNKKLMSWIVPKGSIAIDGVSLTIVDIEDKDKMISVALIPHTVATTTLTLKSIGERVNIETDIIGKYLSRQLPIK